MTAETRRRAVQAARGEMPFDLLLTDTRIVDMVTGEIREADVGIVGSLIASVHPRGSRNDAHETHALNNQFLSPGLMDTHVHLESSHLMPARYAEIVLAQGTTAVFWDPHELANVLGIDGVRFAIEASRQSAAAGDGRRAFKRALNARPGNVRGGFCRRRDEHPAWLAGSARCG